MTYTHGHIWAHWGADSHIRRHSGRPQNRESSSNEPARAKEHHSLTALAYNVLGLPYSRSSRQSKASAQKDTLAGQSCLIWAHNYCLAVPCLALPCRSALALPCCCGLRRPHRAHCRPGRSAPPLCGTRHEQLLHQAHQVEPPSLNRAICLLYPIGGPCDRCDKPGLG